MFNTNKQYIKFTHERGYLDRTIGFANEVDRIWIHKENIFSDGNKPLEMIEIIWKVLKVNKLDLNEGLFKRLLDNLDVNFQLFNLGLTRPILSVDNTKLYIFYGEGQYPTLELKRAYKFNIETLLFEDILGTDEPNLITKNDKIVYDFKNKTIQHNFNFV